MKYLEALDDQSDLGQPSLFCAGGITGFLDWQRELRRLLDDLPGTFVNPRRADFPMDDPDAGRKQIAWEYRMLRRVNAISFWFTNETIQPIALYELGATLVRWERGYVEVFVGVAPGYPRAFDVEQQMLLIGPQLPIADSLGGLAVNIRMSLKDY